MKKFEYKHMSIDFHSQSLVDTLNREGELGWEVAAVVQSDLNRGIIYFKREKEE